MRASPYILESLHWGCISFPNPPYLLSACFSARRCYQLFFFPFISQNPSGNCIIIQKNYTLS
ncbi:rCG62889 [Rattus norvegicus]|uniref:RCG62889 n=1 Tax=Rattus norvegicus TaxID=10116 RepID=A6KFD5_RAT|nr:rCG62889 [Rattus norvegicus]